MKILDYLGIFGLLILHDVLLFALFWYGFWTRSLNDTLNFLSSLSPEYTLFWGIVGGVLSVELAAIAVGVNRKK